MRSSILTLAVGLCLFSTSALAALKPGEPAPAFTLEAAKGGKTFTFDLEAALKHGPVVLYFYPKSFTSVCTEEAHAFAENIDNFKKAGASVIGVSGDDIAVQREFSSKECRDTFPVGADPSRKVIKAYDASMTMLGVDTTYASRISYVIAPTGKILYAYADSEADAHIRNALAAVRAWHQAHPH